MSNRGVAFSVARGVGHVVITVPSAYRLWPGCQPYQQVPIRWGEEGLVLAGLPEQPVVTLTTTQRDRLRHYLEGQAGLTLLMGDPHGRYRIVGQLPSEEGAKIKRWWAWMQRALTSPETLSLILGRYDWPEHRSPYRDSQPPSLEDVAGVVARVRVPDEMEMRRRLMRPHWWPLWALIDAREAELPALYEAVQRHEWGPYTRREWRQVNEYVQVQATPELTVDDVARLILEPTCTEAMRLMVLRGWGIRLWEVMRGREER